jgi:serine/threonine protein kinase
VRFDPVSSGAGSKRRFERSCLASSSEHRYPEVVPEVTELLAPSGLVAGKYRLVRLIGRGGMGAVWEAMHTSLGTRVAVKFIDAEYADSPEARGRFENEARAAAKLRSRHVVEIYDHGLTEDGRPFIVMEYLEGEGLDKRLDRLGRLPAKESARIILQVCRALTKAHALGIVHRDLKPENVFLVWDDEEGTDRVKVLDFGIAKFTDASLGSFSSTRTGSVLGTPHYMSPEQARGLKNLDVRSDLWSVAVLAYRCIVGALPFEGEAVGDVLVKVCTAPIPVPSELASDLPAGFDAWIGKALRRDPAERFSSASELAESLAAVCGLSARSTSVQHDFLGTAVGTTGPHAQFRIAASVSTGSGLALPTGTAPVESSPGAPHETPWATARSRIGAWVAAGVLALIVLGIGFAVALKKLWPRAPVDVAASAPSLVVPTPSSSLEPPEIPVSAAPALDTSVKAVRSFSVGSAEAPKSVRVPSHGPVRPPPVVPASKPPRKNTDIGF